eukprot:1194363-Prorocentrum_minimum.AAC.3
MDSASPPPAAPATRPGQVAAARRASKAERWRQAGAHSARSLLARAVASWEARAVDKAAARATCSERLLAAEVALHGRRVRATLRHWAAETQRGARKRLRAAQAEVRSALCSAAPWSGACAKCGERRPG